jgi:hypothetical protein
VLRQLGACAAATSPTDRRSVACARTAARTRCASGGGASGRETSGGACLGGLLASRGAGADAGAQPAAAGDGQRAGRATSRRLGTMAQFVSLVPTLKLKNSKFLYRSRPSDEYQSCRSSYP